MAVVARATRAAVAEVAVTVTAAEVAATPVLLDLEGPQAALEAEADPVAVVVFPAVVPLADAAGPLAVAR